MVDQFSSGNLWWNIPFGIVLAISPQKSLGGDVSWFFWVGMSLQKLLVENFSSEIFWYRFILSHFLVDVFFCGIFSSNNFGRDFSSGFLVANFVSTNLLDFLCRGLLVRISL